MTGKWDPSKPESMCVEGEKGIPVCFSLSLFSDCPRTAPSLQRQQQGWRSPKLLRKPISLDKEIRKMGLCCGECGRNPHFVSSFTTSSQGISSYTELTVQQYGRQQLREKPIFLAEGAGNGSPWEPDSMREKLKKRGLEKGIPRFTPKES